MAPRNAFLPSPFFVMRTPLLAATTFTRWADDLPEDRASAEALATLRARLRAIVLDPAVREALLVASPSFAARVDKWLADPTSKAGAKVEPVLVRYFARMSARPTPFGLFGAVSMGDVASTATSFAPHDRVERRVRLDMGALVELAWQLEAEPRVRAVLRYRPARVRYRIGARLFAAVEQRKGDERAFRLVAFDVDAPLETTLRAAEHGARIEELSAALCALDPQASSDEARAYVEALVDEGLLVSDLVPPLTTGDPASALARTLAESGLADDAARVAALARACDALAAKPLGVGASDYEGTFSAAPTLARGESSVRRLQVDAVRPGSAGTLGPEVMRELALAMDLLPRLLGPPLDPLAAFRAAFAKRFEQRRVPLAQALDADVGISLERTLSAPAAEAWNTRATWLLEKLERAWTRGEREVALDARDVRRFDPPREPLPESMAALFAVLAPSDEAVRRGAFRLLFQGAEGPSGARLVARFGVWNPALHHALSDHVRGEAERRPGAVFAEIVQQPTVTRDANIVVRTKLRPHEIVLCGTPGARDEECITVDDLDLSLEGERFVLRSRRLGREVVPRLSSAHNYFGGQIELYRFLCELQDQKQLAYVYWNWRGLLHAPQLPRVTCGRLVLARAAWRLDRGELDALAARTTVARFRAMETIRRARGLPRFVGQRDEGSMLPVDLDNPLSVDAFATAVKGASGAELVELFVGDEQLAVQGANGARWTHEIVVPFFTTPAPAAAAAKPPPPAHAAATGRAIAARRHHAPGTEWLYVKLDASDATIERLLRSEVPRIVESARAARTDRFFFVRFADPEPQLRLRFHGEPGTLLGAVLGALRAAFEPLVESGLVRDFGVATYEREIERYGGDRGIELAEAVFDVDSRTVLELLGRLAGEREADRWRWVLLGMHRMLADFGFDAAHAGELVRTARRSYAAELAVPKDKELELDALYRRERAFLDAVAAGKATSPLHADVDAAFARRSRGYANAARELVLRARRGELTERMPAIVASLLHMFANRMFARDARTQEFVAYAMLDKMHAAQRARAKK